MSGFPVRPSRAAFGPKPVNRRPVKNPAQEMDGPTIADLLMWQSAGMGVVSPVAWIYVPVAAGAIVTANVAHSEAWNPDSNQTAPTPARTGAGVYTVQYATQYPDKDGALQTTNLRFGAVFPQGLGAAGHFLNWGITRTDGRTFQIDLFRNDTAAHDDGTFVAIFW
jgi:hypothetical protein